MAMTRSKLLRRTVAVIVGGAIGWQLAGLWTGGARADDTAPPPHAGHAAGDDHAPSSVIEPGAATGNRPTAHPAGSAADTTAADATGHATGRHTGHEKGHATDGSDSGHGPPGHGSAAGPDGHAAHPQDPGQIAAAALVPRDADGTARTPWWYAWLAGGIAALFLLAVILGVPTLKLLGPPAPEPDDHAHADDHDHGSDHRASHSSH